MPVYVATHCFLKHSINETSNENLKEEMHTDVTHMDNNDTIIDWVQCNITISYNKCGCI